MALRIAVATGLSDRILGLEPSLNGQRKQRKEQNSIGAHRQKKGLFHVSSTEYSLGDLKYGLQ
jgi:hypothetical protein